MATSAAAPLKDPIDELIKLLMEEREFSGTEIAETIWLALQMQPQVQVTPDERRLTQSQIPGSTVIRDLRLNKMPIIWRLLRGDNALAGMLLLREVNHKQSLPKPSVKPKADLITSSPQVAGILPTDALPVWLTDPAMLNDPLAVIQAMKPLLRKVDAGTGYQLNEAATVDFIARTRMWLPVLDPELEPCFDILLVVDRGSSMRLWQRLVDDLVQTLKRYGAFRDLQVFDLEVNVDAITPKDAVFLRTHPERPSHRPSEVLEQRGRRIAIVLSDCAGEYWWNGTLLPMLQTWAAVMPTAIWQMLPEWMWERTALGRGTAVALSNGTPGATNQQLLRQVMGRRDEPDDAQQRVSVPIITTEVRSLTNWSLMLAGDRREVTPGFLLPKKQEGRDPKVPKAKAIDDIAYERLKKRLKKQFASRNNDDELEQVIADELEGEIETIARDRIQRFQQLSSPQARRLVMLLAAAPVITLPVMRLIRNSMLYQVRSPLPVAEVFLSGLLQRLPGQEDIEADMVQYDFVPKVRKILLKVLPTVDTIDVINSVSAAVEERWNQYSKQDFRAFLTNPNIETPKELAGLRSFASITAEILKPLGGRYAEFAEELLQGSPPDPTQNKAVEDDFGIPPLRNLDFLAVEVIDEGAIDAEGAEIPVRLIVDQFNTVSVVVDADGSVADDQHGLEQFEFIVKTIVRESAASEQEIAGSWVIQQQRQTAYRFVQVLTEAEEASLELELVSIPGGSFMMGSLESEPQRESRESPQHEVTVEPFFMGRYPITQAQWRFVASLGQVNRKLKPDPSRFIGDNRPVEQVNWHDAIEFCDRISRHTGNEYRLSTEAEWEYACRAGTKTPFHFGETVSSELANYAGDNTYNNGPKGEYREETTPVEQFNVANAWGLCDMHGNVFEWCLDYWHNNYEGAPTDGSAWVEGGNSNRRVRRGGSWYSYPGNCRSASRIDLGTPDLKLTFSLFNHIGFRVVCRAPRALQT